MRDEMTQAPKQLGLKISAGAYASLARRAKARGMSPTTLARVLLLEQIGHGDEVVMRRPRRRGTVRPLTSELKSGITLLRELQLVRVQLERLASKPHSNGGSAFAAEEPVASKTLDEARRVFWQVLDAIAGKA